MPEPRKTPFSQDHPCIRCGYCCKLNPCYTVLQHYASTFSECPDLAYDELLGIYVCELFQRHEHRGYGKYLCIGMGCAFYDDPDRDWYLLEGENHED